MYGTQAISQLMAVTVPFENDVNMYGTQAGEAFLQYGYSFENDVNIVIIKVIEDLPN